VKEHFGKKGSIVGLYKDERDQFYSKLYSFLITQLHDTVEDLKKKKKDELH
jgi:hypothetical protein